MIDFYDYLDVINCNIRVRRYHNQQGRWSASIENSEVRDGVMLISSYGNGRNPNEAIANYLNEIKGKLLVINATSEEYRKEYTIPNNISFKLPEAK